MMYLLRRDIFGIVGRDFIRGFAQHLLGFCGPFHLFGVPCVCHCQHLRRRVVACKHLPGEPARSVLWLVMKLISSSLSGCPSRRL